MVEGETPLEDRLLGFCWHRRLVELRFEGIDGLPVVATAWSVIEVP